MYFYAQNIQKMKHAWIRFAEQAVMSKKMCPEKMGTSILFVVMTIYSPNFLRISLGMAFLLMRKSMVLAAMKALVMYQIPL